MRKTVGMALLVTASIATFAPTAAAQERRPPPLPLEVTFSTPVEGEADVRLDAIVRIQFSRNVDVRSLEKRPN